MRLPAFITDRLFDATWATMRSRPADVLIGKDDKGLPYMQRWHAIPRNKFFNCYLHLYWHDDDRILHSHPWWSMSICVSGSLREYYTPSSVCANKPLLHTLRFVDRGDIVWRSADMFHRLEVGSPRTITIFFTGPKIKTWYFACKHGLMHWRDYDVPQRGCGEDDAYPTNH
jgi:hypothetical protein